MPRQTKTKSLCLPSIELDDDDLPKIFDTLDSQCREKLGKGCLDLLDGAREEMYY